MNAGGYREVLKGLQNTLTIAVLGLLIGIVIGTVIAAVRVLPKYKRLPRVLNSICGFYVGLFRGTPMVVQLLVFYYVLLPLLGVTRLPSVTVATLVFGLNSGAYISEIMRSGILSVDSGQMEGGRSVELHYKEYFGALPWRGFTKFVVDSVVSSSPAPSRQGAAPAPGAGLSEL